MEKKKTAGELNPSQMIDIQYSPSIDHKWINDLQLDSIKEGKKETLMNEEVCVLSLLVILFLVVSQQKQMSCLRRTSIAVSDSLIYCYFWSSRKTSQEETIHLRLRAHASSAFLCCVMARNHFFLFFYFFFNVFGLF